MRALVYEIARMWDSIPQNQIKLEKGLLRMDELSIVRDLKRKATMRIGDDWVIEIPPMRKAESLSGHSVCWVPGEVLPRFAKYLRDSMQMDIAVGDVAYYRFGGKGRDKGRKKYRWWLSGHEEMDLSQMEMSIL